MMQGLRNKERIGRQKGILLIMKGVIVVLCVLLIASVAVMIEELHGAFHNTISETSLASRVEFGQYEMLVENYHQNLEAGARENDAIREYYGVAKYYEAASFYQAFTKSGDPERAQREKEKMDAAYEEMGGWQIVAKDIDRELGITQE